MDGLTCLGFAIHSSYAGGDTSYSVLQSKPPQKHTNSFCVNKTNDYLKVLSGYIVEILVILRVVSQIVMIGCAESSAQDFEIQAMEITNHGPMMPSQNTQ